MTKKHFEAFAAAIQADLHGSANNAHDREHHPATVQRMQVAAQYAADLIAHVAAEDNPRFDRNRFMAACGLGAK